MKRSEKRILTTHVGSLQRPPELIQMLAAQQEGKAVDKAAFDAAVAQAVRSSVRRQAEAGLDVVNDGEMPRASYATYIADRLSGFEGPENPRALYAARPDAMDFPEWNQRWVATQKYAVSRRACNGAVAPRDSAIVRAEIASLKAAAAGLGVEELFMTAISPASVANNHVNQYYATDEEYLYAIADALRTEYAAIVAAGLVLQIDCVDLGGRMLPGQSVEELRKDRAQKVDLINHATRGLPLEQIRIHVCWGASEQPHHNDAELRLFLDILLTAHPHGLMLTGANARHRHEWRLWKDVELPAGKVIIPGVIDNTTHIIEHPEVVAERIVQYAGAVGRENVIAGVDCGFSSNINIDEVDPKVTWAKLRALAEGAELASKALWPA